MDTVNSNYRNHYDRLVQRNLSKPFTELVCDNRDVDCIFIDKVNKHYAENDEIIKLVLKPGFGDSKRFRAAHLLARTMGLAELTSDCFAILTSHFNGGPAAAVEVKRVYERLYGIDRNRFNYPNEYLKYINALKALVSRGYATIKNGKYILKPEYKLPKDFANKKFMVIELMEDETSKPVEL